jgi:hypothetical protein
MSFVVSPSYTFRTEVQHVQTPAKKASGRVSSNANQTGGCVPWQRVVLGEAGERHDTPALNPKPASPVRGRGRSVARTELCRAASAAK